MEDLTHVPDVLCVLITNHSVSPQGQCNASCLMVLLAPRYRIIYIEVSWMHWDPQWNTTDGP